MTTEQSDAQRAAFEKLIEGHGGPALSLRLRKNEDGTYHWVETRELFAMFCRGAEWQSRSARWDDVPHLRDKYHGVKRENMQLRSAAPQPPEAAPVRKPLTDAEVTALIHEKHFKKGCWQLSLKSTQLNLNWYRLGLRDAEAFHGIKEA